MDIRTQIGAILRSPKSLSAITGKPVEKPAEIAMNAAGLLAVSEAAGIFAMFCKDTGDEGYIKALKFYASLSAEELKGSKDVMMRQVAERIAHATWASCQIYRGIIETPETPYARLERKRQDDQFVLDVYDLLPPEETAKDWEQIKKYATKLLELIEVAAKAA